MLAQSLWAASRTVEDERQTHSLHGYFLRPGDSSLPVLFSVDRIRDGRSFTTRRVVAIQRGEAIFNMSASFHVAEEGLSHQLDMPELPGPEELADDRAADHAAWAGHGNDLRDANLRDAFHRQRPFEFRSAYALDREPPDRTRNPIWVRFRRSLTDDPRLHAALLAYASDMGLVSTAAIPHRDRLGRRALQMASLDHALWIHRAFRVDDWLLFLKSTTNAEHARGFNRAEFYSRDGILIASVAQEALMRPHAWPDDSVGPSNESADATGQ